MPAAITPSKKDGHLAADVGANSWQELEFRVTGNGLQFRKAGTDEKFIRKNWAGVHLDGLLKPRGVLCEVAKFGGTRPKEKGDRGIRKAVLDLNKALKSAFGLTENPFRNDRTLGVQANVAAISDGRRK